MVRVSKNQTWSVMLWLSALFGMDGHGAVQASVCTDARDVEIDGRLDVQLQPAEQLGLLWIEELGSQVQVQSSAQAEPLDINGGPVRYGVLALDSRNLRSITLSSRGRGRVRIAADCPVYGDVASLPWWSQLQQVLGGIDSRKPAPAAALARLVAAARTPFQLVTAMHGQAYAWSITGRGRESVQAYADVAERWLSLGQGSRAGAATLGAAESAFAAGWLARSMEYAQTARSRLRGPHDSVFHTRALEAECRAHQGLGEAQTALACLGQVVQRYASLADRNGMVNTLYAVALNHYGQGQLAESIKAEDQALALAGPEVLPVPLGRVHLQRARRLVDSGAVAAAIEHYAQAMQLFAQSRESARSWEAEALSKLTRLYAKLGMADTAYRAVTQLLEEVPAEDDPAQVASLLVTLSHVEEAAQRPQAALRWAQAATALFQTLTQRAGAWEGRLREAELRLRHDLQPEQALSLAKASPAQMSDTDRSRLALVEALQAMQAGDPQRSETLAQAIDPATLDRAQRNLLIAVRVRGLLRQALFQQALELVHDAISEVAGLAQQAHNAGLGWIVMRSSAALRPLLIEVWSRSPVQTRSLDALWLAWLQSLPAQVLGTRDTQSASFAASTVIASEFLYGDQPASAQAELVKAYALTRPAASRSAAVTPNLSQVRAQLGAGEMLLVLASAQQQSILLVIERDTARSLVLPSQAVLLEAVLAFSAKVQDRSSGPLALTQARVRVEQLLFQNLSGPRPRRLYVLLDDVLANLPLSALHWPGDAQPLVAQVPVSWVSDVRHSARPAVPRTLPQQAVAVLVASNLSAASARLPSLQGATMEGALISAALPRAAVRTWQSPQADRGQFIDELSRPGNWLHLASHGWSDPGAFGHAGVWLASAQSTEQAAQPQFLSWLDVADQRIEADLVVLNACQLASTDVHAVSQGSMSFALAVSAAGARNTVAAFWPVSDAATAMWVPAFYGWMAGRDADASAEALRRAQQALRSSRAYRHPYYWASLGHFRRLDIAQP